MFEARKLLPTLTLLLICVLSGHSADVPAFKQAVLPRVFSFPADHASHSGYQTEWWYVTGNVRDDGGKLFGYQFTIFRRAMDARTSIERGRKSAWAADDFYLLHLAISAVDLKAHASAESLQRGVLGQAGATDFETKSSEIKVWMKGADYSRTANGWKLKAALEGLGFDLDLKESVPPVLHGLKGEEGLSRKGPRPGQASYYYSVPFLKTTGTLTFKNKSYKIVDGNSWMDHEFGSNQLSAEQSGWEWFSIHLADGRALMLYILRNKDGSIESHSSGSWIQKDGRSTHLALKEFELIPGRKWKSPRGAEYALDWTIKIPSQKLELTLSAAMDDQEFHSEKTAGMNYYEGAIRVQGSVDAKPVSGEGYLEITGGGLGGKM